MVGSSRNSRSGSPTSAQATARRCFCPPDSFPTQLARFDSSSTSASTSSTLRPAGIEGSEQPQGLFNGKLLAELRLLQLNPEPRAQAAVVAAPPTLAQHLDLTFVGCGQAFKDLDRRRLARAVWAEQAEALAAAHFEVEAADGDDVGVALDETVTADGEATHDRGS